MKNFTQSYLFSLIILLGLLTPNIPLVAQQKSTLEQYKHFFGYGSLTAVAFFVFYFWGYKDKQKLREKDDQLKDLNRQIENYKTIDKLMNFIEDNEKLLENTDQLAKQNEIKEKEIKNLKDQISSLDQKCTKLLLEEADLKKKLIDVNGRESLFDNGINYLKDQIQEKENSINKIQEQLNDWHKKNTEREEGLKVFNGVREKLLEDYNRIEAEFNRAKQNCDTLDKQVQDLNKEKENFEFSTIEYQQKLDELKKQEELKKQLEKEFTEKLNVRQNIQNEIQQLVTSIEETKNSINLLNSEIKEKRNQHTRLQKEKGLINSNIEKYQEKILKNKKFSENLNNELETKKQESENLENKIREMEEQKKEYDLLIKECLSKSDQSKNFNDDIEKIENIIKNYEFNIQKLEPELREKTKQKKELFEFHQGLQSTIEELNQILENEKNKFEEFKKNHSDLEMAKNKFRELKKEIKEDYKLNRIEVIDGSFDRLIEKLTKASDLVKNHKGLLELIKDYDKSIPNDDEKLERYFNLASDNFKFRNIQDPLTINKVMKRLENNTDFNLNGY